MSDFHHHDCCETRDCCEPKDCCCEPKECYCKSQYSNSCNSQENNIWLIILIVVVLCLFCGGNDNRGGLFGGLF